MCNCTECGSADPSQSKICIQCHNEKMQVLLDKIEDLQRELSVERTRSSFAKTALQYHVTQKKPVRSA